MRSCTHSTTRAGSGRSPRKSLTAALRSDADFPAVSCGCDRKIRVVQHSMYVGGAHKTDVALGRGSLLRLDCPAHRSPFSPDSGHD